MRRTATILAIIGLAAISTPSRANAYWTSEASSWPNWRPYSAHSPWDREYPIRAAKTHHGSRQWRHEARRGGGALPGPCYLARRQGGPCGCVAEGIIFRRYDHVLNGVNLWLADAWLGFPQAAPAAGTAAVWPGRHVEAVVANNGDGTVTTLGPRGHRRVRISSVVIVDPHGRYDGHREGHRHYASRHYRHWHPRRYARA